MTVSDPTRLANKLLGTAAAQIQQAKVNLILDEPFFGMLAKKLRPVANLHISTFRTNFKTIEYNPHWVEKISVYLAMCETCHEVLHNATGDQWRRGNRDPKIWNLATEHPINFILQSSGFQGAIDEAARLGKPYVMDIRFKGMCAEEIYPILVVEQSEQYSKDGESNSEGNDNETCGPEDSQNSSAKPQAKSKDESEDANNDESNNDDHRDCFIDTPTEEVIEAEQEWKQAVIEAAKIAQGQGKLPAALQGFVEELTRTKYDWRSETLRFAQERAKDDYSWRRPNARYISHGLYLPALYSEQMGEIVISIDTSGSVYSVIPVFGAHVQTILDVVKPRKLHVIYCDDEVQGAIDTFEPGDVVKIRRDGGGGTDFRPVFERIETDGIEPACLIYLTDLCGSFPDNAPSYPVLWASVDKDEKAPFGETVYIEPEDR